MPVFQSSTSNVDSAKRVEAVAAAVAALQKGDLGNTDAGRLIILLVDARHINTYYDPREDERFLRRLIYSLEHYEPEPG